MNNTRKIMFNCAFTSLFLLSACSKPDDIIRGIDEQEPEIISPITKQENHFESPIIKKEAPVIEKSTAFITIDSTKSLKKESNGAFYIYGETSDNCSSISVQASNDDSDLFDDYELEEYSYGDTSFRYGIREDWDNLATGLNKYSITAYCDDNKIIEEQAELNYTPPPETKTYAAPSGYNYDSFNTSTPESVYTPPVTYQYPTVTTATTLFDTIDYLYRSEADLIVDCDDEYVYLGKITDKYDSDSIFNKYGDHGSKYNSNSIWNKYGDYGSKYSDCSPFSKYASSPPMIVIGDNISGYLSNNKYAGGTVISPNDLLLFAYQKWDDDHWLDLMQD